MQEPKNNSIQEKTNRAIALMREAGLDPKAGLKFPVVVQTTRLWAAGELDDVEFMRAMRNLTILNPALSIPSE